MTTHSWGELAAGLWTLEVDNDGWDGEFTLFTQILLKFLNVRSFQTQSS